MTSSLLPTYARYELAFERGEGAWLTATDGRALSRFRRRHRGRLARLYASPSGRGAHRAGATSSGTPRTCSRSRRASASPERLVDATFADEVFFTNSGAEALEARHQDGAQVSMRSTAQPERFRIDHLRGRLPRPHAGDHRRRRQCQISRRLRPPRSPGFDQVPFGDSRRSRRRSARRPAPSWSSRSRARAASASPPRDFLRRCARSATSRPAAVLRRGADAAWGAPASSSPTSMPASRPTSWHRPRASAAVSRWAPAWRPEEAGKGMTVGTHGTTYGGNPLAMAGRQRRARRGARRRLSRRRSRARACCCKQRLAGARRTAIPTSSPKCAAKG